jgi:DNA polymerase (family 10)
MAVSNVKIAELLRRYARTLELERADRFKIKAYKRAAATVETLTEDVPTLVLNDNDLTEIPNVGKAISEIIKEIVATGMLSRLESATAKLSPELAELATHPGLDPKKVKQAYKKLGVGTLAELKEALNAGDVRAKLGSRLEFHIRQGLDDRPRMLLWAAADLIQHVEAYLKNIPGLVRFQQTGSLRRKRETIGDLNYVVSGKLAKSVLDKFAKFGAVQSVEALGPRRRRYVLSAGRAVTLTWSPESEWGLTLVKETGSAAHLAELKATVEKRYRSLSAKAVGRSAANEAKLYSRLGLHFIEPELREGNGEVEAARAGALPLLVEVTDIRGDLHMHTTASDGANTILEMAKAGKEKRYRYIAITDHSKSLKITNGLSERRLHQHLKAIDKLNSRLKGIRILKSAEVDILENGKLDYSSATLKELDLTICSIHSKFGLPPSEQTERIMRAMDNPYFNILGHATGRLLLRREGYDPDIERLIAHAKDCGCYFEINSNPNRLDLSDEHARWVKDAGMKIAVNTDAHSIEELEFITAGINQARRAWLEASDILNTLPLAQLMKALRR